MITGWGRQYSGHRIAVCRATVASDWGKAGLGQLGPQMLGNWIKKLNEKWTQPWFLKKVKIRVAQRL